MIQYTTLKKVNFKVSNINVNRLNGRLAVLTKNNVLNTEELNAQKLKEKERLKHLDKEKDFIEFAKANKEEPLVEKKEVIENTEKESNILQKNETEPIETMAMEKAEIIQEDITNMNETSVVEEENIPDAQENKKKKITS